MLKYNLDGEDYVFITWPQSPTDDDIMQWDADVDRYMGGELLAEFSGSLIKTNSYSRRLNPHQYEDIREFLSSTIKTKVAAPVWAGRTKSSIFAPQGDISISVNEPEFFALGQFILISRRGRNLPYKITGKTGQVLTLERPLNDDVQENTAIIPMFDATINDDLRAAESGSTIDVTVSAEIIGLSESNYPVYDYSSIAKETNNRLVLQKYTQKTSFLHDTGQKRVGMPELLSSFVGFFGNISKRQFSVSIMDKYTNLLLYYYFVISLYHRDIYIPLDNGSVYGKNYSDVSQQITVVSKQPSNYLCVVTDVGLEVISVSLSSRDISTSEIVYDINEPISGQFVGCVDFIHCYFDGSFEFRFINRNVFTLETTGMEI